MDELDIAEVADKVTKKAAKRVDPALIMSYLKERLVADDQVKIAQGCRDSVRSKYTELGVNTEDVDRMAKAVHEINKITTPQDDLGKLMKAVSKGLGYATDSEYDEAG